MAAWNCHGGPSSPELPALRFPATRRVGSRLEPRWCSWGRGEAAARPGRDFGAAEQRGRGDAGALHGGAVLVRRLGFVAAFGVGVRVQGGSAGAN